MEAHSTHQSNNCTLYPGEYIPMLDAEELKRELKKVANKNTHEPFINVSEKEDHFKVEVASPGLKREDFFINIENNILTITVLHKRISVSEAGKFQVQEFNYDSFSRHVLLPENVETEFVRAEYNDGILSMYLPKTKNASKHSPTKVIVY